MLNSLIQQLNNSGLPLNSFAQLSFYFIAGLTCLFAFLVVASRNVFHSAVFLALTLLSVSGIYLLLDAQFLAVVQIIIYVGAIMILFVFCIMLTSRISDKAIRQVNQQVLFSLTLALIFLAIFYILIIKSPWLSSGAEIEPLSLKELGRSLFSKYVLPFEVISLVLLAVMVGAIAIGKARKE
ncbi:MAG: NADH-quinone oxidoreductase subunit J [Candidatus Omnitrophota bacterium]|nr:NADH-quinone oxidoreductase subunit J [Candidatus Omnitrophota bacterium]